MIAATPRATARAALALGLSLALALTGCKGRGKAPDATKTPAPVLSVRVQTVTTRSLEDAVTVTGAIAPWQTVQVSPQSAGLQVLSVNVDEGARVRRGQVLATLDNRLSAAQLANARAAVATAEATLADARYNFERYKALRAEGGVTGPEMSQRQTAVATATANVAQARASLAQVQVQFGQSAVTAPTAGLVLTRSVQIGDVSAVGKAMFTLARDGRLEMDANVAEADLGRVRVGQAATVSSDAVGGLSEKGVIEAISPGLNTQSRLAVVKIRLPNPSRFRVGMFATGRIALGRRAELAVSADAVATRDGRTIVFVVDDQDVVHLRPIETLDAVGGWTPVRAGLDAGDRVVTDGVGFLKEGDRVTVIAGEASPRPSASATASAPSAMPASPAPSEAPGARGTVARPPAAAPAFSPAAVAPPPSAPAARPSIAAGGAPAPSPSLSAPSAFPSVAASRGPVTTVPTPESSLGARIFEPTTAPSAGGTP